MPHFSSQNLADILARTTACGHYWLAYSGGLDSSVLFHALSELQSRRVLSFSAVHVHHGLNISADDWVNHCQQQCEKNNIPYKVFNVDASPVKGESPEARARQLRYESLSSVMQSGDVLLTAHHQDDQAETLLLQLMRGSGVPGLSAMPFEADFAGGKLLRPLLEYSRADLEEYAKKYQLDWVEDDSNHNRDYDRNYTRHEIMPALISRWPGVVSNLNRTAGHMADAAILLDQLAMQDLEQCEQIKSDSLNINKLNSLGETRQRNVLRYWLKSRGLNTPSQSQLEHVFKDVLSSRADAVACVKWPGVEVRKYRDQLFSLAALSDHDACHHISWNLSDPLHIKGVGTLQVKEAEGKGLNASFQGQALDIRFRQGGETIRPANRGHRHDLKKLFQEAGVPPWERDRTPMLYQGDEVLAIAGLCVCESYQAEKGQPGLILEWNSDFS
ncbi:MAG: tRNA lysidine(34) synthetase TilS [Gammaproteobacteria bacterium]|nr:tRNA lysidine(34) synthetase TilS [Gammaproteobacteria bacterium]